MKAVTYITENTVMKFLYNPKKTFLEGFVKKWLRFDSGTYQDYKNKPGKPTTLVVG